MCIEMPVMIVSISKRVVSINLLNWHINIHGVKVSNKCIPIFKMLFSLQWRMNFKRNHTTTTTTTKCPLNMLADYFHSGRQASSISLNIIFRWWLKIPTLKIVGNFRWIYIQFVHNYSMTNLIELFGWITFFETNWR